MVRLLTRSKKSRIRRACDEAVIRAQLRTTWGRSGCVIDSCSTASLCQHFRRSLLLLLTLDAGMPMVRKDGCDDPFRGRYVRNRVVRCLAPRLVAPVGMIDGEEATLK